MSTSLTPLALSRAMKSSMGEPPPEAAPPPLLAPPPPPPPFPPSSLRAALGQSMMDFRGVTAGNDRKGSPHTYGSTRHVGLPPYQSTPERGGVCHQLLPQPEQWTQLGLPLGAIETADSVTVDAHLRGGVLKSTMCGAQDVRRLNMRGNHPTVGAVPAGRKEPQCCAVPAGRTEPASRDILIGLSPA